MESKKNSRELPPLFDDLTRATKNNDQEEKKIDEFNDFFANLGEKLARKFNSLKELRVRKQNNSLCLADITQSETSNTSKLLKINFSLDTYELYHY